MIEQSIEDQLASAAGEPTSGRKPRHMMLSGPPGTGKTTVARTLGSLLKDVGVASNTKFEITHPSDLVGEYMGDAEKLMKDKLAKAKGGVLFVDEAHQFAQTEYGKTALRALIEPMGNKDNPTTVIFAGYPDALKDMMKVDPGLRRRIGTDIKFRQFKGAELEQIMSEKIEEEHKRSFASDKSYAAFSDAMRAIEANPNHGSIGDAEKMYQLADDARLARVGKAGKGWPIEKRRRFNASDWKTAVKTYQAQL